MIKIAAYMDHLSSDDICIKEIAFLQRLEQIASEIEAMGNTVINITITKLDSGMIYGYISYRINSSKKPSDRIGKI